MHAPVPEHPPPDHPLNFDTDVAVAARVTNVPFVTDAVQVVPQSMPEGVEITVPLPVPLSLTLKVYEAVGIDNTGLDGEPSPLLLHAVAMQEYVMPLVSPV